MPLLCNDNSALPRLSLSQHVHQGLHQHYSHVYIFMVVHGYALKLGLLYMPIHGILNRITQNVCFL